MPGAVMAKNVVRMSSAKTVNGETISIKSNKGKVTVNKVNVKLPPTSWPGRRDPRERSGVDAQVEASRTGTLSGPFPLRVTPA